MIPKRQKIILASGSAIRRQLLTDAGLDFEVVVPQVDEASIRNDRHATGFGGEEIALKLARAKAEIISLDHPSSIVIGADQILVHDGRVISKAKDKNHARRQLAKLSGDSHRLISAVAIYENNQASWHRSDFADLTMRDLSANQIDEYLDRNWTQVQHCVGCYMLENRGPWLFSDISGDYFTVLGLPLLDLLGYLSGRGIKPT